MTDSDLKELKEYLEKEGVLDASNRDLIEDALFRGVNTYAAQRDLKCLASNLKNAGETELAATVERFI